MATLETGPAAPSSVRIYPESPATLYPALLDINIPGTEHSPPTPRHQAKSTVFKLGSNYSYNEASSLKICIYLVSGTKEGDSRDDSQ